MASTQAVYKLTDRRKRANQTMGILMTCHRCGRPLRVGEVILRNTRSRRSHSKYYHKDCWESMFFDPTVRIEA